MSASKKEIQEDFRKKILEAAKSLFLSQGYAHTSMRKIAMKVGISATTIYLYYTDKADVIHALHQDGFKLLYQQFKALMNVEDPFERLKAMGRCYIQFALENRDYYEIMFVMRESLKHVEHEDLKGEGWQEGKSAFQSITSVIKACQEVGYFQGRDLMEMTISLWANVHGLCNLTNNGRIRLVLERSESDVEMEILVNNSFELYLNMLERL